MYVGGGNMASSEAIKKLIKAHLNNDTTEFRRVSLQIAAKEASSGHTKVANEIRELVDNVSPVLGQTTDINVIPKKFQLNNSELKGLLKSSYTKEKLKDMILDDETKIELEKILIEWKKRRVLESYGLECRKKILLIGPPGCGKTMSAKAIAGELSLPLFSVKLDGLISRYLGETSIHLRNIFDEMRKTQGVYLFDEFDSIGNTRNDFKDVGEIRRVLSSFLIMLEEFDGDSIIIAATNYEKNLDWALFRRFDSIIKYSKPETEDAIKLIKLKLRNFDTKNINWNNIKQYCNQLSYSEITKAVLESIKISVLNDNKKIDEKVLKEELMYRKKLDIV